MWGCGIRKGERKGVLTRGGVVSAIVRALVMAVGRLLWASVCAFVILVVAIEGLTISTDYPNRNVNEGDPVTLYCKYTGNPMISWKKIVGSHVTYVYLDKKLMGDLAGRAEVDLQYGVNLKIKSTLRTDTAKYRCEGVEGTKVGEVDVQLDVGVAPVKVEISVPSSAKIGSSTTFTCSEPQAYPAPTYTWYRNDIPFPDSSEKDLRFKNVSYTLDSATGKLTLKEVKSTDTADYMCQATNGAGSAKSSSVHMEAYKVNSGAIAAAVVVVLLILLLLALGLYYAYNKGYLKDKLPKMPKKKTTTMRPKDTTLYDQADDEGDFKHKPSFNL
uniref:Junctional adhesion molecule A n=1 Tax=Eptatretus burgeri TaxID=7764 RepID=A0A8C4R201_EPTBU